MDPDIDSDIVYDILVDIVNISYPISGIISYPISLHYGYRCTAGARTVLQIVAQAINHMSLMMVPAISKWMLMICAIIWAKI